MLYITVFAEHESRISWSTIYCLNTGCRFDLHVQGQIKIKMAESEPILCIINIIYYIINIALMGGGGR